MSYCSITYFERMQIERMRNPYGIYRYSISEIAHALNRAYSSIYREIKNNYLNSKWYDAEYAQNKAEKRRKAPRVRKKTENTQIKKQVDTYLSMGLSPDVMVGRSQREGVDFPISRTSIYTLIYKDANKDGNMYEKLPSKRKKLQPRNKLRSKGAFEAGKTRIDQRDEEIKHRKKLGHWEMDTIVGAKHQGYCHTMVERVSRFGQIIPLDSLNSVDTQSNCWKVKHTYPEKVLSFTGDNGSEFSYYSIKYKDTHIPVYFTYPHAPWEKGAIEHYNKMIRSYLPKGTSLSSVPLAHINRIVDILNHRPRKILGYRTPYEVFCNTSVAMLI